MHVHCQSSCSSLSYLKFEINITKLFYTGVFGNFRLVGDAGDLSVLISGSVLLSLLSQKYIFILLVGWLVGKEVTRNENNKLKLCKCFLFSHIQRVHQGISSWGYDIVHIYSRFIYSLGVQWGN